MLSEEDLNSKVGYQLPGGEYLLEPYKNWLTNDVVGAPNDDNRLAHPMFCYYAAMAAMGLSLEEFFALFDSSSDDGVMFGEAEIDIRKALTPGTTYTVSGQVTGVKRKNSRKLGVFDLVDFELTLHDGEELVGVSKNSFIFPRELINEDK